MSKLTHETRGFVLSPIEVAESHESTRHQLQEKKRSRTVGPFHHSPLFCRDSRVYLLRLDPVTSFDPNCL